MFSFAKLPRSERAIHTLLLLTCLCGALQMAWVLYRAFHAPLWFDDAFMFYRYALHLRSGLGVSWNLDGLHAYGETSLMWGYVVVALSYLPLSATHTLVLGSWVFGVAAMAMLAYTVSTFAQSGSMKKFLSAFACVLLPLAFANPFDANLVSGMETMLAMFLLAVFLHTLLLCSEGRSSGVVAGLAGLAAFVSRPDMALAIVIVTLLVFWWRPQPSYRSLMTIFGVFGAGVMADLIACKAYFGSALPLGFHMKSHHAYKGYHHGWEPLTQLFVMVRLCLPYLVVLAFFARREDRKLIAAFLLPAMAVSAYMMTVTQIMGHPARYFMPYLPLIVLPALFVLDRRLSEGPLFVRGASLLQPMAVTALLLIAGVLSMRHFARWMAPANLAIEHRPEWYSPVVVDVAAKSDLPKVQYADAIRAVSTLAASLPQGDTLAATEVGYLGASVPKTNVIDLAGLNDTRIALDGFSVSDLLARKPDVIWMPHTAYTYQHGLMMSDSALLSQYDVYAGGALYGIAVRRDSPNRALLEQGMQRLWKTLYGSSDKNEYLVKSASWDGNVHSATDEGQPDDFERDTLVHATQE